MGRIFCPSGKSAKNLSSPFFKNISLHFRGKSLAYLQPSRAHQEGRFAIVTNVGCGERWTRGLRLTSAA